MKPTKRGRPSNHWRLAPPPQRCNTAANLRTRPMKDRVREAVLICGDPQVAGQPSDRLFAGTGALGWKPFVAGAKHASSLSGICRRRTHRAKRAALGPRYRPRTAESRSSATRSVGTNAYQPGPTPVTIFCSPRMIFTLIDRKQMLDLIAH